MSRFLVLTWDGAGNTVPFQAVVEGLQLRGHDVAVWSHASNLDAFSRLGARTTAFPTAAPYDARDRFGADESDHARWVLSNVIANAAMAEDALTAIEVEQPDAVVVDDLLLFAHAAVQSSGLRAAALAHVPIANRTARERRNTLLAFALDRLNAHRESLGLRDVRTVLDAIESTGPFIAATAPTFDPPSPESPAVQVGPVRPSLRGEAAPDEPEEPLVIVALSSGWMHQVVLLQRILHALEPLEVAVWVTLGPSVRAEELRQTRNSRLFGSLPHERVLPMASLLVTHAGHGTIMAGLAAGVPMLCMPLGRDQPTNAARAAELGAADVLDASSSTGHIRAAASALLDDLTRRVRCEQLAASVRAETRLDLATSTLERLVAAP
ncbi:MAG TPA: glycosyltransferase [Acidimicrobiales bacterium]|jgi:UDP:flavonoid glycosyltransferase YjiC (YdhE family)|nr:glycosyltransferase [Acidimicrobiales bacterium]